jgi:hypothetical protein
LLFRRERPIALSNVGAAIERRPRSASLVDPFYPSGIASGICRFAVKQVKWFKCRLKCSDPGRKYALKLMNRNSRAVREPQQRQINRLNE